MRTPSNQLIELVENDETLCVVPIAAAGSKAIGWSSFSRVGDQEVGIGRATTGIVDIAGAIGAAVAQQIGIAAGRGIEGGVERDRAGEPVDDGAGSGNCRSAGPGEDAGTQRQRAARTVGLGECGDEPACDLVELALHGAARRCRAVGPGRRACPRNRCCRRCRPAAVSRRYRRNCRQCLPHRRVCDWKETVRGMVSNSVAPSLVMMTMSLSERVIGRDADDARYLLEQCVATCRANPKRRGRCACPRRYRCWRP